MGRQDLNVGDEATMKSRVLREKCGTCIFRPGNPFGLKDGRLKDFVDTTRRKQSFIVCHDTYSGKYPEAKPAICRGFFDRYKTQALQLIERLWGFLEVEPPGGNNKE